jgi:hypothetical protein
MSHDFTYEPEASRLTSATGYKDQTIFLMADGRPRDYYAHSRLAVFTTREDIQ